MNVLLFHRHCVVFWVPCHPFDHIFVFSWKCVRVQRFGCCRRYGLMQVDPLGASVNIPLFDRSTWQPLTGVVVHLQTMDTDRSFSLLLLVEFVPQSVRFSCVQQSFTTLFGTSTKSKTCPILIATGLPQLLTKWLFTRSPSSPGRTSIQSGNNTTRAPGSKFPKLLIQQNQQPF